jgi:hypothetical protein
MNRFLLTLLIAILFINCTDEKEVMILSGTVKGLKKGKILLQKVEDTSLIDLDSVIIDGDPNFLFKRIVKEPEVHYLYLKLKDGSLMDVRLPFFAEAGEVNVRTELDNFILGAKITGSLNQDKIYEHQRIMDRFSEKNLEIIEQLFEAQQQENDSLVSELDKRQRSLITSRYLATVNFSLSNKELEVAPYLMSHAIPDINKKYLDTVYQSLSSEIRNSIYGKDLESLINSKESED